MFTARRGFKLAGPMSVIFAHCADLVRGEQAPSPPERPVGEVGRSDLGLDAARGDLGLDATRRDVGLDAARGDLGLDAARPDVGRAETATGREARAEQPATAVGLLDEEPASGSWIPAQRPRTDEWLPGPVGRSATPVRRPTPVRPRWLSRSLWLSWPDRPRWLSGAAWSRLARLAGRPGVMVTMLAGLILLIGTGCALMIARDGARPIVRPVDATADPTAGLVMHDLLPASGASLVRTTLPDSATAAAARPRGAAPAPAAARPRGAAPAPAAAAAPAATEAPTAASPPAEARAQRKSTGEPAPLVAAPAPNAGPAPAAAPAPAAPRPHVATQRSRPSAQQPNASAPSARSGSSVPPRTATQANSRPAAHPSAVHRTPSIRPDTTRSSALKSKADDRDGDSADREFDGSAARDDHRIERPNGPSAPGGLLDGLTNSLGGGLLGLG